MRLRTCKNLLVCLLVMALVSAACTSDDGTTTHPDVEATVLALLPTATPTATPNLDATIEARIAATVATLPTVAPRPSPTATASPAPAPAPTAAPVPVPTSAPPATPTPRPVVVDTPTPSPTATRAATRTPTPVPTPVMSFGPRDIDLSHNPGNGTFEYFSTGVDTADAVVTARFVNPYDASDHPFSYGIFIRVPDDPDGKGFACVIHSDGWVSGIASFEFAELGLASGLPAIGSDLGERGPVNVLSRPEDTPLMRQGEGEVNEIEVTVTGLRLTLSVNDWVVGEVAPVFITGAGDVVVATGVYEGTEQAGAVTRVLDLTVRPAEEGAGPVPGV